MSFFKIDVCLIGSRRPDVLEKTLESFSLLCFKHFHIERFIVNLDPIFGTKNDEQLCIRILERFFPYFDITIPSMPNFCNAVKTVWSKSTGDLIFHLEDDWIAKRDISDELLSHFKNNNQITQISFNTKEKSWRKATHGDFHEFRKYRRILGIKIPLFKKVPIFTTSPSIIRGDFARNAAFLMKSAFDAEKQFYSGVNMDLQKFCAGYRNMVIGDGPDFWIEDIGRNWSESRGIKKLSANSISRWEIES